MIARTEGCGCGPPVGSQSTGPAGASGDPMSYGGAPQAVTKAGSPGTKHEKAALDNKTAAAAATHGIQPGWAGARVTLAWSRAAKLGRRQDQRLKQLGPGEDAKLHLRSWASMDQARTKPIDQEEAFSGPAAGSSAAFAKEKLSGRSSPSRRVTHSPAGS